MSKYLIYIFFFLLLHSSSSFSQNLENELFNSLCKELLKKDKYLSFKEQLHGVYIVVDAESFKESIIYPDTLSSDIFKYFKTLEKKEQIDILKCQSFPIYPLRDTTYIVDTLRFFSENISYAGKSFFKVERIENGKIDTSTLSRRYLYLKYTGLRGNDLDLAFSYNNTDLLYVFHFKFSKYSFRLFRSSVLTSNNSKE